MERVGSTMSFLAAHKFDFNTCFTNGVQYLTRQEEAKMMAKQEQHKARLIKRIEEAKGRTPLSVSEARKKLGEVKDAAVKRKINLKKIKLILYRISRHVHGTD